MKYKNKEKRDSDIFITQVPVSQLPLPFSQYSEIAESHLQSQISITDVNTQEINTIQSHKEFSDVSENVNQGNINEPNKTKKKKEKTLTDTRKENINIESIFIESQNDIANNTEETRSDSTKVKKKKKKPTRTRKENVNIESILIESENDIVNDAGETQSESTKVKKKKESITGDNKKLAINPVVLESDSDVCFENPPKKKKKKTKVSDFIEVK